MISKLLLSRIKSKEKDKWAVSIILKNGKVLTGTIIETYITSVVPDSQICLLSEKGKKSLIYLKDIKEIND